MDVMNVNLATAATGAHSVPSGSAGSSAGDFAKVLASLAGASAPANDAAQTGVQSMTTWRDALMEKGIGQPMGSSGYFIPSDELDTDLAMLLRMLETQSLGFNTLESADGTARSILDIIGRMQQRLRELLEQEGQMMAAQQMAALMNLMSADSLNFFDSLGGFAIDAGDVDASMMLESFLASEPADALLQMITQANPVAAQAMANAKDLSANPDVQLLNGEDVVETQHWQAPVAAPETGFDSAVRAAKEQMTQTPAAPAEETDIDALQQQVDAGAFLRNTALAPAEAPVAQAPEQPLPVAEQLEEGILTGLKTGDEEFTIKLRPEGLGDVTIRLNKTAEGMLSLSIIAKSAETQRVLAAEANALKDTLRPYRVEVESILTEQQDALLSQQQSFAQQQRQNNWQTEAPAHYGRRPLQHGAQAEPLMEAAAPASARYAGTNVLDTYI